MKLSKQKKIIYKAACLMRQYGHVKKQLGSERIGFCVAAAIRQVMYGSTKAPEDDRYRIVTDRVFKFCPAGFHNLATWNDHKDTTQESIVKALEKATQSWPMEGLFGK